MKQSTLYLDSLNWHGKTGQGQWMSGNRGPSIDAPLEEPSCWLEALGGRGVSIDIVLSLACVRTLTLPWSVSQPLAGAVKDRVRQAWKNQAVDPSTHDIRIRWPDYGMPLVSLAYPQALLQGLGKQLAPHRVATVECAAFALAERRLSAHKAASELLMLAELDGYSALHVQAGKLIGLEHLPLNGRGLDALPVWLKRKAMDYPDADGASWLTAQVPEPHSIRDALA